MIFVKNKKSKHELRANTIPALFTVGPVTLLMILLVAVPLVYVGIMSFCSLDEFYNVTYDFTFDNYKRLINADLNGSLNIMRKVVGERAFLVDGKVKYPIEVCSTPVVVTSLK